MYQKNDTPCFVYKTLTYFRVNNFRFSVYLKVEWLFNHYFAKISFVFCKFE